MEKENSNVAIKAPISDDMKIYFDQLNEFNERTGEIQKKAMSQFRKEGVEMIRNISKVIAHLEEKDPGMSVFFMRDIGDIMQDWLHDFNPYYYPTTSQFVELKKLLIKQDI